MKSFLSNNYSASRVMNVLPFYIVDHLVMQTLRAKELFYKQQPIYWWVQLLSRINDFAFRQRNSGTFSKAQFIIKSIMNYTIVHGNEKATGFSLLTPYNCVLPTSFWIMTNNSFGGEDWTHSMSNWMGRVTNANIESFIPAAVGINSFIFCPRNYVQSFDLPFSNSGEIVWKTSRE
jgi:hypothetical protein